MRSATAIIAAAAFALGGLLATAPLFANRFAERAAAPQHPQWAEVRWPFPMDEWGRGKAFRCAAAHCGTPVTIYLRAKIGFCKCETGVDDDTELSRISDFILLAGEVSGIAPGRPIRVAWMMGRSRAFTIGGLWRTASALSIGFNDRCDALVATAVVEGGRPELLEAAVLEFLNGKVAVEWAEVTLGL